MRKICLDYKNNNGQVMLLTVLIISGVILGATTIAGLLMLNQIRQTTNVVNSLQALYAADAGLEWHLYTSFVNPDYLKPQLEEADFITEELADSGRMEFRSVGCAGALFETIPPNRCPRRLNRSLQLVFELVE